MFKKLNNSLSFSFTLIFILILICSTSSKASCVFNCPKDDESSSEFSSNEKGKRYFEDQPDLNDDYQIHFIYMLDKDGKDNEWDINGKMQKELEELNEEMFLLTGNKQKFKFDYRTDGKLDITFIRLDRKGSSQGWNNSYADYFIQKLGFNNPKKLYYVWADVVHSNGGQMGVHSGYTFLKSRHNDGKKRRIQITMHELLHGQGFAWKCTDGNQNGHVLAMNSAASSLNPYSATAFQMSGLQMLNQSKQAITKIKNSHDASFILNILKSIHSKILNTPFKIFTACSPKAMQDLAVEFKNIQSNPQQSLIQPIDSEIAWLTGSQVCYCAEAFQGVSRDCLLYTSPSPRDQRGSP